MTRIFGMAGTTVVALLFAVGAARAQGQAGVLIEADSDTVTKFIYVGSNPNSHAHPAVSVEGKRLGIKAVANETYGAAAVIGQVEGAILPGLGPARAGVMGAGYYGVMGRGSVGVKGEGTTGVFGSATTKGVYGEGEYLGVEGVSSAGIGVVGQSTTSHGIKGVTSAYYQHGVRGEGPGSAVYGISTQFGGVYGTVTSGGLYGTVGHVSNPYQYAVYGQVGGTPTGSYAGYFQGNVVVTGYCNPCSPSDTKFKKNIRALDGGLQKIMALRPKTYEMKTEEYKGTMDFAAGLNYGLLAEEVATVLPELVHKVKSPPKMDAQGLAEKNGERVDFQAISYSHLIPILIQAIQEQQARIEALEARGK